MTTSETLAEYYGLTYRVIHRQLNGLTHNDTSSFSFRWISFLFCHLDASLPSRAK